MLYEYPNPSQWISLNKRRLMFHLSLISVISYIYTNQCQKIFTTAKCKVMSCNVFLHSINKFSPRQNHCDSWDGIGGGFPLFSFCRVFTAGRFFPVPRYSQCWRGWITSAHVTELLGESWDTSTTTATFCVPNEFKVQSPPVIKTNFHSPTVVVITKKILFFITNTCRFFFHSKICTSMLP